MVVSGPSRKRFLRLTKKQQIREQDSLPKMDGKGCNSAMVTNRSSELMRRDSRNTRTIEASQKEKEEVEGVRFLIVSNKCDMEAPQKEEKETPNIQSKGTNLFIE